MFFNIVHFILGITFGLIGINHAADKRLPVVHERNCTHVTFSYDFVYSEHGEPLDNVIYFDYYQDRRAAVGRISFDSSGNFVLEKYPRYRYSNRVSLRADPIPKKREDNYILYVTLHLTGLDAIEEYRLSIHNELAPDDEAITSTSKVQISRCFPQDDIIGCNPYCLCDTVVQKKCEGGSSISGKCSDSRSITNNTANYKFSEPCGSSSKPSSSGSFSSKPTSSGSISSKPSSSGSISSKPTSSGSISSKPTSSGSISSKPTSSGSFPSKPSSSGSFSSKPTSSTEPFTNFIKAFQSLESIIGISAGGIIVVLVLSALLFYRKKKKGSHSLSDESENNSKSIKE